MPLPAAVSRLLRPCAVLVATVMLSACATDAPATTGSTSPQTRSPLAAPPSSMMTPHGY